ncbi:MAG: hypothetical protein KKC39_02920 [Candidatus Omnitrophica bacterium]|nr:hypothetical protein [Candidatus Omnitrophota bacterium]MBU4467683.1 hypothetical protein [Candidatus Omnitrophota bacterium]MCG2707998.1 hypothetical protein [Candidatus Omnitrophota bacterium]
MKAFLCLLSFVFCLLFSCFFVNQAEAGISMRLMALNPADSEQTVTIKAYLPLEVKPEDVIYKDDLEVIYDTQQGSYYVYGEYQLKPKEVLEKEIELRDVWVIDASQISMIRQEAKAILESFKKTNSLERATALYNDIDKKLKDVEQMQAIASASPGYKISNYRNSLTLLNSAKADLLAAKTLLAEVAPKGMAKLTWKIILFIIIFLGILGAGFFFIWQRQAKLEAEQKPQNE